MKIHFIETPNFIDALKHKNHIAVSSRFKGNFAEIKRITATFRGENTCFNAELIGEVC